MEVSGVRSSWETLAIKSRRLFSMRSVSVRSRSTATAPPPGIGAAVTSNVRPEAMVFARAFLNRSEKFRVAHAVNQRSIQSRSTQQQTIHAAIRPLDAPVDIHRDYGVLH